MDKGKDREKTIITTETQNSRSSETDWKEVGLSLVFLTNCVPRSGSPNVFLFPNSVNAVSLWCHPSSPCPLVSIIFRELALLLMIWLFRALPLSPAPPSYLS
jgi:hypothetical protein